MADRVSATITIGGALPRALLNDFEALVQDERLSLEWDGEPFNRSGMPDGAALKLMAHEVVGGQFDALEAFCVAHHLPFARWSAGYVGQWEPERVVFVGTGDPISYRASSDDRILIDRETVERIATKADILEHFILADLEIPPLRIVG